MLNFVRLVERMTLLQDGDVFAAMALTRCNESQGAVAMDLVVSVHKPDHPLTGFLKAFEGLVREAWVVL